MSLLVECLERFSFWLKNNHFDFPYAKRTIDSYLTVVKHFLLYLDAVKAVSLAEVNTPLLRHFIRFNHRGVKYHYATLNIRMAALHIFFHWAAQASVCEHNPLNLYKETEKETRKLSGKGGRKPLRLYPVLFISEQEQLIDRLMEAKSFNGIRDAAIILLMLAAAPRPEGIVQLPLHHVSFADACLRVIGKGNKERLITLDKEVKGSTLTALRTWLIVRERKLLEITGKAEHPLLFITNRASALSTRLLRQQVSYRIKQAGISGKDQY